MIDVVGTLVSLVGFLIPNYSEKRRRKRETLLVVKSLVQKLIDRAHRWKDAESPDVGDIVELDHEFLNLKTDEVIWDFDKSDFWRKDFESCGRERLLVAKNECRLTEELGLYLEDLERLKSKIDKNL